MKEDDFDKYSQPNAESMPESARFTMILNDAIRDSRLSWRAKGILAGCMSHGSGFKFNKAWILSHGTEGRDAISSALKELREFGYLENKIERCQETGKIKGERLVFRDRPGDRETSSLENRMTGKPAAGKPGDLRRPEIQEDQYKENQLEAGKIAVPVEPTIPATAGKPPEPPLAAPRKGRGRRSSMETALDSLPGFAAPYRAKVEEWLTRREKSHRAKPEITSRTLAALEYANSKNVIEEVCDVLSERNWYSLGFTGYKEFIDRIAADKKKTNGSRLSPIAAKPETNGALCATITADPLTSPHEEFFSIEHLADNENYIDL